MILRSDETRSDETRSDDLGAQVPQRGASSLNIYRMPTLAPSLGAQVPRGAWAPRSSDLVSSDLVSSDLRSDETRSKIQDTRFKIQDTEILISSRSRSRLNEIDPAIRYVNACTECGSSGSTRWRQIPDLRSRLVRSRLVRSQI